MNIPFNVACRTGRRRMPAMAHKDAVGRPGSGRVYGSLRSGSNEDMDARVT